MTIPKLRREVEIVPGGRPTLPYHQWWDALARNLNADLADMQTAIETLQVSLDAIDKSFKEVARITSYPNPTNVLTAADVGSTATITVAAHERVYPVRGPYQIENVSITSGTITGLAFSTKYYVYYDDESLTLTNPTFVATTSAATAQVGGGSGRHFLGEITTPADGAGSTSGTGPRPPGNGGPLP